MGLMQEHRLERKVTLKYTPSFWFTKNAKDNFNSIVLSKSKLSVIICTKFYILNPKEQFFHTHSHPESHTGTMKKKIQNISELKRNHCSKMKISEWKKLPKA
jgi:hypothetical protein